MFSLLWSEHCAYKHSKKLLRTLPTEGPHVLMGPGENAGAVDVGDGLAVAFKVESHNHPSAVEPFQGAATGVGGILRDIFAIGARPIAVLDSLRFGEPTSRALALPARSRGRRHRPLRQLDRRADGRRRGLLRGRPTRPTAWSTRWRSASRRRERLIRSAAAGVGNVVVLFGASTGRDGIGGASVLASAELGEDDEDKRPTVQIGDPFEEKQADGVLRSSCSSASCCVSLQDLGAAGLTSSSAEMASKGGVGIDIDVARVPLREADMEPFEIMVSESQERMLCVVEPARVDEVLALCESGRSAATAIGEVTDTRPAAGASTATSSSATCRSTALVDDCPLYDLDAGEAGRAALPGAAARRSTSTPTRGETLLARCSRSPNIASRRPLFEQYDCLVAVAHRAPARAGRRRGAAAAGRPARSPSRSTATAAAWPATRTAARSRRCSSAPRTSPASAPSRSASRTA